MRQRITAINSSPKPFQGLFFVAVLIIVSVALAMVGWYVEGQRDILEIAYRSFKIFILSDTYNYHGLGGHDNPYLEVARWLGMIVAFWAVITVFWIGLGRNWAARRARHCRNHTIIIGETDFADALSQRIAATSGDCVQMRNSEEVESVKGRLWRLPYFGFGAKTLEAAGAGAARRIVIAVDDDATAVDLALSVQRQYPSVSVATRVRDIWLAHGLNAIPGGERLRAFSEPAAAAREVLRRHPPYLLVEDLGQTRIHVWLIGDHEWVEAIMVEIILISRTVKFGTPAISVVVRHADALRQRLMSRYPEMDRIADTAFFDAEGDDFVRADAPAYGDLTRFGPVTAVYCGFDAPSEALSVGMGLRNLINRKSEFKAPLFVRMGAGEGLRRSLPGSSLPPASLIPFASLDDVAHGSGFLARDPDPTERQWHEVYLAFEGKNAEASKPWETLDENYRLANRRAVDHVFAKLFEAGFDLRPWLAQDRIWLGLPALGTGEALYTDAAMRDRLGQLEHERWNIERRLSGWVYGPARDNARKIHDNLVAFDKLPEAVQKLDYDFIDFLNKHLKRAPNGLKRV